MAKLYGSTSRSPKQSPGRSGVDYGSYKDRNIAGMKPEEAQELLKPTEAEPVQLQKRMAGCS